MSYSRTIRNVLKSFSAIHGVQIALPWTYLDLLYSSEKWLLVPVVVEWSYASPCRHHVVFYSRQTQPRSTPCPSHMERLWPTRNTL